MIAGVLLHRIIKSGWLIQHGVVSSQAFRPSAYDHGQLSVYDGNQITAEASWRHHVKDPARPPPVGVLSVSVDECSNLDLQVRPDPDAFPEHMLIDFSEFGISQVKKKSSHLRDYAMVRGWQFRPPDESC